jgi:hypothetical protein
MVMHYSVPSVIQSQPELLAGLGDGKEGVVEEAENAAAQTRLSEGDVPP